MKLTYGRGYVYSIQYHIVWCVKYRRKVLVGDVERSLYELLNKIAEENDFQIIECNGEADHIHLLIDCSPQHYIPDMLKALKGVSARLLMKQYGDTEVFRKKATVHDVTRGIRQGEFSFFLQLF